MGLFHLGSSSSSNHTCPMPSNLLIAPEKDFISGFTFRQFNMILSGSCAAFVTLVIFILMWLHATHYSRPNEQQKIIKICWLLPMYSCFSFITIAAPNSFAYIEPWLDFFQSMALASFFLLLCNYISPNESERERFFIPMRIAQRKKGQPTTYQGGLEWYRRSWIMIFQYPVVSLGVAIVSDITQAAKIYCVVSSKPYFAHLWLSIIINISLLLAVMTALKFEIQLKTDLAHHKPLAKLLAFKLIVGTTFILRILFWILRSANVLKQTDTLTYSDVNMGIQTMATCIIMVPFALFFPYAYDVRPYFLSNRRPLPSEESAGDAYGKSETSYDRPALPLNPQTENLHYQGDPLGIKGLLAIFDYREIIRGIVFAFRMGTQQMGRGR